MKGDTAQRSVMQGLHAVDGSLNHSHSILEEITSFIDGPAPDCPSKDVVQERPGMDGLTVRILNKAERMEKSLEVVAIRLGLRDSK